MQYVVWDYNHMPAIQLVKQNRRDKIMKTLQQQINEVQARVDAGRYDSLDGQRPFEVFVDRDGDISVAYHASGDRGSMPWETKVA